MRTWLLCGVHCCFLLLSSSAYGQTAAPNACKDDYVSGQRFRMQRKLLEARQVLQRCARPPCRGFIVGGCTDWLADVQSRIPAVVPMATDEAGEALTDVHVFVDGDLLSEEIDGRAKEVNPAWHTFSFERANGETIKRRILVPEGDKDVPVTVRFYAPKPHPPTAPVQPWMLTLGHVLTAAGLVWAAVGTAFGIEAIVKRSQAGCDDESRCSPQGANTQWNAYYAAWGSTTSFALAGALCASGIGFWIAAPKAQAATAGLSFRRTW